MNKLNTFLLVAYDTCIHESGTAHYFNDTEFFSKFYSLVLDKSSDVIDLGFNVGMQAELFLKITDGNVYGFEASKRIFEFASEKFKDESRVILFNKAVSNVNGSAEFIDTDVWGAGSLQHTAGMDYCGVGDNYSKYKVDLVTLDDVLPDIKNIKLIKLDIEGAEILAMDGAKNLIKFNRPFMVMEYCHNALSFEFRNQKIQKDSLFHFAQEIGYKVYNIYGICLSNYDVWSTSILQDTADVFLIPDEQHEYWATQLLPKYQYYIYDKILEQMELSDHSSSYYMLASLPARIYQVVNNKSMPESHGYMESVSKKLSNSLVTNDQIFSHDKLSKRGAILLALILSNKIDDAYRLSVPKSITSEELLHYENLIK